jgi:hypothetical protein
VKDHTVIRVIYYWRGERHEHSRRPETQLEAVQLVDEMRKAGFRCHFEQNDVRS